jgi:transposase-like protein
MKCSSPNPRAQRTAAKFPQRLQDVHEGRIVLRDDAEYENNRTPIDVTCTVCGHEWSARPNDLINKHQGCPECARLKKVAAAGINRKPRVSKAFKEFARRCHFEGGMPFNKIGKLLNKNHGSVMRWCDSALQERARQQNHERNAKNKASGYQAQLIADYQKTPHGRSAGLKAVHKRRSVEYHALDTILIDGAWHHVNMMDYITTAEDRAFWSFPGADDDVAKRKKQQIKLGEISGEPYSLEHLVPLSKGGIHHPFNFANRALALNKQKRNSILSKDVELFCARLFN